MGKREKFDTLQEEATFYRNVFLALLVAFFSVCGYIVANYKTDDNILLIGMILAQTALILGLIILLKIYFGIITKMKEF